MKWVTRERPKTDRIACPWLIRRFIDPEAEIVYAPPDAVVETAGREGGRSFDAEGADYTHQGRKCSFEVLVDEFDLGGDPALVRLARIVHAADVSDDPNSARSGGDLGFFTQGSMEPAIDKAAFSLKLGKLSDPVLTPYGWHILEVIERDTLKTRAGRDSLGHDGKPLLEAHARHILIRVPVTDDDAKRAKKLAKWNARKARADAAKPA